MNLSDQKSLNDARKASWKAGGVERAYAVLEIKSIDEDERVIEGIATTPSPDAMDDIIESEGAEFKLPLPFLKQHRSGEPIGHVVQAKVTPEGIHVRVKLVKVSEPAALKERLDIAWAEIKSGLVRGLSIGFSPLEWTDIKGTYGVRYVRWAWRELSAVTIPANAEASITSIKAIDQPFLRAASGRNAASDGVRLIPSPGVSGKPAPKSKGNTVKTYREQIEGFEATLVATKEKRDGLMTKAAEEGRTLNAEEKETYDGAQGEIKELSEHIERLKALDAEALTKAKPVTKEAGTDPEKGTEARQPANSGIHFLKPNVEKGIAFARYVKVMALANGNPMHAHAIAQAQKGWKDTTPQVELFLKTAVGAGTSTGSAWADDIVYAQNLVSDFIEYLRPATIIGRIPGLRRVPFNIRVGSITSGGTAYWIGQGVPIPMSKLQTDNLTLERTKAAGLMSITQELARDSSPSAEMLVRDDLRDCIAAFLDTRFIDPSWAAVANVSPASITNDVTAVAATGTTAAALRTDIATLKGKFVTANIPSMNGVWIMTETSFIALAMMTNALGQPEFPPMSDANPTFMGRPVIVSQSNTVAGSPTLGDLIIYVIPSEVMMADEGGVEIEVSNQASLEMSDAPANNAATGTGASMVSMFQTNSIAIRAIRYINWKKRRAAAAQYITNALYRA